MGSSTAPIPHLLLHSPQNPKESSKTTKPTNPNSKKPTILSSKTLLKAQRRQFLLSTLPICLTFQFSSLCSALAAFDPVTPSEREASNIVSKRVAEAVELLERARELQAQGDFSQALEYFTQEAVARLFRRVTCTFSSDTGRMGRLKQLSLYETLESEVVEYYKDFAFSEYARVGRAINLYEVGDRDEAIAELEDVSISLKGYPEVHAALAAALYVDKHAPVLAENQFTIATILDPHYTDLSYVKETKHWPPSLVSSLEQFITLS